MERAVGCGIIGLWRKNIAHLHRAPWKGAITQWGTDPPGNRMSGSLEGQLKRFQRAVCSTLFGLLLLWAGPSSSQPNIVFSVSGDQALIYPASIQYLPDEHTTIIPAAGAASARPAGGQPGLHYFFVAMSNQVGNAHYGDAFVLQSSDFRHFVFPPGFGNAQHGSAVFWPAHPAGGSCAYTGVTHFDEQYA
ncbi:MAG: hypothetical protein ACHRXM_38905, partial [Isosphaerales bacterium]